MEGLKVGYRAVFYDHDEKVAIGELRKTFSEAENDIEAEDDIHKVFKYKPYTHAFVEDHGGNKRISVNPGVSGTGLMK